jgi:hypothetical protein
MTRLPLIVHEKAGIISPGRCWVVIHREYLYCHATLPGLLWQMICGWKNDRHMVG